MGSFTRLKTGQVLLSRKREENAGIYNSLMIESSIVAKFIISNKKNSEYNDTTSHL